MDKTFDINSLVRECILKVKAYSSARDEFTGSAEVFLDANENPFGNYNRYPDPYQKKLKERLSVLKNISIENIAIGNGSDEIIDLTIKTFCEPKSDKIIICPPTYGIYEVSAAINDVDVVEIPLTKTFQLDTEQILQNIQKAKILFICSPNNPSGNDFKNIDEILQKFQGIIFIDEAYIDFSSRKSSLEKIKDNPNIIISQTMSKAWGLASARVGIAYANPKIIDLFNKVKPPYNVSSLNQEIALQTLQNLENYEKQIQNILEQRKILETEMGKLPFVERIYPSDANFLLVEFQDSDKVFKNLVNQKIIIRNRAHLVPNTLRITIGNIEENKRLLHALRNMENV